MNGQIVLCQGINDREELDRTIGDLAGYRPKMQSLPSFRPTLHVSADTLRSLEPFTKKDAAYLIDQVEGLAEAPRGRCADPAFPHFACLR